MKRKKLVSIFAVVVLIALFSILFLLPENKENIENTGAAVINTEQFGEFSELTNEELLSSCLEKCGKDAASSDEVLLWSKICSSKLNTGRSTLEEFMRSC